MKKEDKLFCSRMKAALTGNIDDFNIKPEGLVTLSKSQLDNAGFDKNKFCSMSWDYEKRSKTVVEDPRKRLLVRNFFEQDRITVLSEAPRSREVVTVEGVECMRRYYLDSVDNLVAKFLEETPEFGASESSAKKILKSFPHFRNATEDERLHSCCKYCRQLQMFTDSINRIEAFDEYFMTCENLVNFACCENVTVECVEDICVSCQKEEGKRLAVERLELLLLYGDVTEECSWVILGKDENNKEGECQVFGTVKEFIEDVSKYLSKGCDSSGTGRKPAAHLSRLVDMQRERRNIFKQLDNDKNLVICEIDHGDQSE